MNLASIPQKSSVFVDANTFVYHFSQHPVLALPCTEFLNRVISQDIQGLTSANVMNDVAHRLMVLEASTKLGWAGPGITQRLRRHPAEIQKLAKFEQAIREVAQFGIQVLPTTAVLVEAAATLSQKIGLLSGDALIMAIMQNHGLTQLASHDGDFDRVPGIIRFALL